MIAEHDAPPFEIDVEAAEAILALADDELVIGHRHSEWLGLSPFLEEDLTMASIAQDELGHARALYALVWPSWTNRDAMVVCRAAFAWRSCAFVERTCDVWEDALVRHLLYDIGEGVRWPSLVMRFEAAVAGLADLAERASAEERYHRRHAIDLVTRLGTGTRHANMRLQHALDALWADSLAAVESDLEALYVGECTPVFEAAALMTPSITAAQRDRTTRSDGFGSVHDSLLAVASIDPTATW